MEEKKGRSSKLKSVKKKKIFHNNGSFQRKSTLKSFNRTWKKGCNSNNFPTLISKKEKQILFY